MSVRRTGPLSTVTLVDAALAIVDAEGLDALSIRRLATEHGVTPMAMYRHFADKDALLGAVAERLLEGVETGPAEGADRAEGDWEARLRAHLEAFLGAIRPHPDAAELVLNRILDSEAGLRVAEHALALLVEAGLDPEQAAEVGTYQLCALVALVTSEPGPRRGIDADERAAEVRRRRAQLSALDPARFGYVVAAADTLADCRNEDGYFDRGTALILGGIRTFAGARSSSK